MTNADDILDSREAKVVAETLAIGELLMTMSIRMIDSVHEAVADPGSLRM